MNYYICKYWRSTSTNEQQQLAATGLTNSTRVLTAKHRGAILAVRCVQMHTLVVIGTASGRQPDTTKNSRFSFTASCTLVHMESFQTVPQSPKCSLLRSKSCGCSFLISFRLPRCGSCIYVPVHISSSFIRRPGWILVLCSIEHREYTNVRAFTYISLGLVLSRLLFRSVG